MIADTPTSREGDAVSDLGAGSVKVYSSLDALPHGCARLMAGGFRQSLYHSQAWYRNFSRNALGPEDQVRIYTLEPPDPTQEAIAALPLRVVAHGSGVGRRRGVASLANYYSSLYGPNLADPESESAESVHRLVAAITAERPRWDFVNLSPLSVESVLFSELMAAFRKCGMVVQPYFCFGNWYLDVAGRTSAEYFSGLPPLLKSTIKRKRKKLEGSRKSRISIVTGGKDLDEAISDYEQIYSASWKVPEPHPGFVPGLVRTCAEMGWLRLGLLYVDAQPVAAQVWIVIDQTASIYKLAYDDKYASLSPGTLLTTHLMQHAIDVDRVRIVDYLTGDDAYKQDWMSHRRERWGILALNPRTVGGVLSIAEHVGGRMLKKLFRNLGPHR